MPHDPPDVTAARLEALAELRRILVNPLTTINDRLEAARLILQCTESMPLGS